MKVLCFWVRDIELPFFENVKNKYKQFEFVLEKEHLTHENIEKVKGFEAVIVIGGSVVDKRNLDLLKEYGVKYIITRNAGTNHIDLEHAGKLGYKVGNVPAYSPNAISEYAVALGSGLIRGLYCSVETTGIKKDFRVLPYNYTNEIRFSTIGIIGTGRIGYETAKAYKALGAKVLGYDLYPNKKCEDSLQYVDLDTLLKESDLVSIHCPYIPGENNHMVNKEFFSKMKDGSFLVNAARGEILDPQALYDALISNKLKYAATDVVERELEIYNKKYENNEKIIVDIYEKLHSLYPRLLMTPHIAAYTIEATKNMVEIAVEDLVELVETGNGKNCVS